LKKDDSNTQDPTPKKQDSSINEFGDNYLQWMWFCAGTGSRQNGSFCDSGKTVRFVIPVN
jgi:hypothetical protein